MRCGAEVAALRREPSDESERVTEALHCEPLELEETRGGWARVVTAYGYLGWIRVEDLEQGDGDLDPDAVGATPVDVARRYIGAPYLWGGMTTRGIDCSGLVHIAYRRTGRLVPRDAHQQEDAGVAVAELRPGDLISYGLDSGSADHVAFWVGEGRILHSTGRDCLGVVEEREPPELRARRRRTFSL